MTHHPLQAVPEVVYLARRARAVDVEPAEDESKPAVAQRRLFATRGEILALFQSARKGET